MADEMPIIGYTSLDGFKVEPTVLDAPVTDPLEEILEAKRKLDAARRIVFVHPDRVEAIRAEVEKEGLAGVVEVQEFAQAPRDTAYVAQGMADFRQRWICEPGDVHGGVADE